MKKGTKIAVEWFTSAKEDISQIVYEVVNYKAANVRDKDERAPIPQQFFESSIYRTTFKVLRLSIKRF